MIEAEEVAKVAEQQQRFADAAAAWERAAAESRQLPSPTGVGLALEAARAHVRAGAHERALTLVEVAADEGFAQPFEVKNDASLSPLAATPRFAAAVARMKRNAEAFSRAHSSPEAAVLRFDDVERFWKAYDSASLHSDAKQRAAIFNREYLLAGSPGLIDYYHLKTRTSQKLVSTIDGLRPYYEGIRHRTREAIQLQEPIREGLRRLHALYPQGAVPDVTFVIGRLNSGGTAGASGMLVGLDIWSWTEGVPLDGLSAGMRTLVSSSSLQQLPWVVVHEHVHALQSYGGPVNLLREALAEGTADFLASVALPDHPKPYYYSWGLEHEEHVWSRFQVEMYGEDTSDWIANLSTSTDDWSADLGYFIGARIAKFYYEAAPDKAEAIRDLLFVSDATEVLDRSGYARHFAASSKP